GGGGEGGDGGGGRGGRHGGGFARRRRGVSPGAGVRAAGGGSQSDRDRYRLLVVQQQRRQRSTGAEPVPAGHTRPRLYGIAEAAKPVDVAADGAGGDIGPASQVPACPVAPHLQQGKQTQQACRGCQHASILSESRNKTFRY